MGLPTHFWSGCQNNNKDPVTTAVEAIDFQPRERSHLQGEHILIYHDLHQGEIDSCKNDARKKMINPTTFPVLTLSLIKRLTLALKSNS